LKTLVQLADEKIRGQICSYLPNQIPSGINDLIVLLVNNESAPSMKMNEPYEREVENCKWPICSFAAKRDFPPSSGVLPFPHRHVRSSILGAMILLVGYAMAHGQL